jgi:hypothetical protein
MSMRVTLASGYCYEYKSLLVPDTIRKFSSISIIDVLELKTILESICTCIIPCSSNSTAEIVIFRPDNHSSIEPINL